MRQQVHDDIQESIPGIPEIQVFAFLQGFDGLLTND